MTDQIYHKVQYPLKKAVKILKNVESQGDLTRGLKGIEKSRIDMFLNYWEEEGRDNLDEFIEDLINLRKGVL